MATIPLGEFIATYRDELIRRCWEKMTGRSAAPRTKIDHGVPLFLDQLVVELGDGPSQTHEISEGAVQHGRSLSRQGFTVSEVVHEYGDVCQSVTDLAVELDAPIDSADFRTLNRCLDDAIAGAVTEYGREQDVTRDGESHELRSLILTASAAFEAVKSGRVGVTGATGAVLERSLMDMRALVTRPVVGSQLPKVKH